MKLPTLYIPSAPTLEQIQALERAIPENYPLLDVEKLTSHYFTNGVYVRQLFVPRGAVVIGAMHSQENVFFLCIGDMTVWTPKGMKRVQAPFITMTQPSDKRVGYAHEDSVTMNFHINPDNETDLVKLKNRYTVDETKLIEVS